MLVWLDLETTGLDPVNDDILELGMVVTDDDLLEIGRRSWVLFNPGPDDRVHKVVREMHATNGLWAECAVSTLSRRTVERQAIEWLESIGVQMGEAPLAGNTIGFDRSFLREGMPQLLGHFHYRSIDMSTVNELARRWWPALYNQRPRPSETAAHRSLDDLDVSVALARFYRTHVFDVAHDADLRGEVRV